MINLKHLDCCPSLPVAETLKDKLGQCHLLSLNWDPTPGAQGLQKCDWNLATSYTGSQIKSESSSLYRFFRAELSSVAKATFATETNLICCCSDSFLTSCHCY